MRSVLFRSMRDELLKIAVADPARRFILSRQLGMPLGEIGSGMVPGEEMLSGLALKPGMAESMRNAWQTLGPQALGKQLSAQKGYSEEAARMGKNLPFDPAAEMRRIGSMPSLQVAKEQQAIMRSPAYQAEQDALSRSHQQFMASYAGQPAPVQSAAGPMKPAGGLRRESIQNRPPHEQLAMEQAMKTAPQPAAPANAPTPKAAQPPQPAGLRRPALGGPQAPAQPQKLPTPQVAPPPTVPTPPAVPAPAPMPKTPLGKPSLGGSPTAAMKPNVPLPKVTGTGLGKTMAGLAGKLGR